MRYDQQSQLLVIAQRDTETGAIESQIPAESVVLKCRGALALAPPVPPGVAAPGTGPPEGAQPKAAAGAQAPAEAAPEHVSVFI